MINNDDYDWFSLGLGLNTTFNWFLMIYWVTDFLISDRWSSFFCYYFYLFDFIIIIIWLANFEKKLTLNKLGNSTRKNNDQYSCSQNRITFETNEKKWKILTNKKKRSIRKKITERTKKMLHFVFPLKGKI